jgi:ABC-type sugar transport system ATPase subunit
MTELRASGISMTFPGGVRALEDVSFTVAPGSVLALLGPSGCGKSTLLRIVAGLEAPTSGELTLDGRSLAGVSPGDRDVGFVFQNYALYPHLAVRRNLSLALEVRRLAAAEVDARIRETARLLGIEALLDRRPGQLSGGQQQRVALGRALARRPRLYLMDEPLSNLDALLRETMRTELKALFRNLRATVLYVTHDQAEALSLADEVLLLKEGRVRQLAPPLEMYARPADLFAATFVGSPRMTTWRGRVEGSRFAAGGVALDLSPVPGLAGDAWLGIRPEDVRVSEASTADALEANVELVEPTGDRLLLTLAVKDQMLRALTPPRDWPPKVWVSLPAEKRHWFDGRTERRLEAAR